MYHKKSQNWLKHFDFILLDVLSLHFAFVLAYIVRNGWQSPYASASSLSIAFVYSIVDICVLIMSNTMKNVLKRGYFKEFSQTVKHVAIVELIVLVYLFSTKQSEDVSRIVIYLLACFYALISYCVRLAWKHFLLKKPKDTAASFYFISTQDRVKQAVKEFIRHSNDQALVQGICILDKDCVGEKICDIPVTATVDTVLKYLCDKWVDEIYISVPVRYPYPMELIDSLVEMGFVVHVVMEQMITQPWQKQVIENVGGKTVRTISMTMASGFQLFLKRAIDIVGGIVGCIFTGLLTMVLGPIIYIHSPGPIFFKQTRVGKNGKPFQMYKFRSMYLDAEERKAELMEQNRVKDGMMFKLDFDPRIIGTKKLADGTVKKGIGNYIRDWSLDEFPQFFNVLKGELSLCGTRPPTLDEWEKYELHHRARLSIKPGITGMWQVSGRSEITDFEQVVALDKKYIREWNIGLDIKILFQTIKVVLGKEGSM